MTDASYPDAQAAFDFARDWLAQGGYRGPLAVMGRSLGSAPALELAARRGHPEVAGLAVESGFAHTLGVPVRSLGLGEEDGFGNLDKARRYDGPTLVLHGRGDDLIPVSEAEALFEASPSRRKRLGVIPGADHNSLFAVGAVEYREALRAFVGEVREA